MSQPNGSVCRECKRRSNLMLRYLKKAQKVIEQLRKDRKVTVESQTTGYGKNG